ncbi:MAG: DNA polymerase III subunit beta [Faecalibacterium sp.]
MNIICDQHLLKNAIDGVSKAVSTRSAIPVLEGILLKAEGFQLTLTGYDLQMGIVTTIESNVREPGQVVLNAKLLSDMIHRLPAGDVLLTVSDQGNVFIQGGDAQFEVQSMTSFDYPDLPKTDAVRTMSFKASELRQIIDYTLYAVSQDDQKPAHTGMLFEIEPEKLTVVALDGYRLAIVERDIPATKDIRVIIPSKTMQEVNRLLPSDDEVEVHLSANRRFTVFHVNGYTVISRVIEGEFLNYRNVIPASYRTRVTVDSRDFIDTIERASLIITERLKNPLRITFKDNKVEVRCQTNLGKVMDEFETKVEGDGIEIGFNHRYLLDALRNAKKEKVVFHISGALSPVKMLPEEGNDFTYLVLPVRFKND